MGLIYYLNFNIKNIILIIGHLTHPKPFDFIALKNYMKRGKQRHRHTSRLLDRSGPRADSVKTNRMFIKINIQRKKKRFLKSSRKLNIENHLGSYFS